MLRYEAVFSCFLAIGFFIGNVAVAQNQRDRAPVVLNGSTEKGVVVPAGQSAFEVAITLVPSGSDKDLLYVYRTSASTSVSLRTPRGTLITASNAEQFHFRWRQAAVWPISEAGQDPTSDNGLEPDVSETGTHLIIGFPAGQEVGVYALVFDSTDSQEESRVVIAWSKDWLADTSRSSITAGVHVVGKYHRTGDWVRVVAVVSNDEDPVLSPIVVGTASATMDVSDLVEVGGLVLVEKVRLRKGLSRYLYRARLKNNSAYFTWDFFAVAEPSDSSVPVEEGLLKFLPMGAGESVLSGTTISIVAPTYPDFDVNTLNWRVTATSPPLTLNFTEAGKVRDVANSTVFEAAFQPEENGEYSVEVHIEGRTAEGLPFLRNSRTGFTLFPLRATIASIVPEGVDRNGNGRNDEIWLTTTVEVQRRGEYQLSFYLMDSYGSRLSVLKWKQLEVGSNTILEIVKAQDLVDLGLMKGPFQIVDVKLVWNGASKAVGASRSWIADYHLTLGETPAWDVDDFDKGPIYLTGHSREQAIDVDGKTGFDELYVQVELMQVPGVSSESIHCWVRADLVDATGALIETVKKRAWIRKGRTWVAFSFSGPKIARSGKDGPYTIQKVAASCGGEIHLVQSMLRTKPYRYTDFAIVDADFRIDLSGVSVTSGGPRFAWVAIHGIGGYEGHVDVSVLSASPGVKASIPHSRTLIDSTATVRVEAEPSTLPGVYAMLLSATDGKITRTETIPITVTSEDLRVEVSLHGPRYLHPGMSTQLSAAVLHAENQRVVWSIGRGFGRLEASGNTAKYTAVPVTEMIAVGVQANSVADPQRADAQQIVLSPPVEIILLPDSSTIKAGQQVSIVAKVKHIGDLNNDQVKWTVNPTDTEVVMEPLKLTYTAPSEVTRSFTITVTARNPEDSTAIATATIIVRPTWDKDLD